MSDELILVQEAHRPRADAVKNRAHLLEIARQLFDAQGVEAVTMSHIAEAAALGKGTLYRHFKDKNDLCQALLNDDQRAVQDRTLERMRQQPDALDNLLWFLNEVVLFVERNSAFLCSATGVSGSLQHPAHWWWRQTIHALVRQINLPGDPDFIADTLYVMCDVHTIYFLRQVRGYSHDRVMNGLYDLVQKLHR